MKKRCIWNWYRKRKIEHLDEEDRWFKYLELLVIGIFIVIGVAGPVAILIALFLEAVTKYQMPFQNAMRSAGVQLTARGTGTAAFKASLLAQFMSPWSLACLKSVCSRKEKI